MPFSFLDRSLEQRSYMADATECIELLDESQGDDDDITFVRGSSLSSSRSVVIVGEGGDSNGPINLAGDGQASSSGKSPSCAV